MQRTTTLALISASLCLVLSACGKKDAAPDAGGDAKAEAKAESGEAKAEGGEVKAEGGEAKAVAAGTMPKGRSAADNDKSIIDTLAGVDGCKLDLEAEDIADPCEGADKLYDAVQAAGDKDEKATDRTLINLLGDEKEVVRYAAIGQLSSNWGEDPALVGMALAALAVEKNELVAKEIAWTINGGPDKEQLHGKLLPNLQAALLAVTNYEVFETLYPTISSCPDAKACGATLVAIAKQNSSLEIRATAASEALDAEHFDAEICNAAATLVAELSKQPVPKEDADVDFFPHEEAGQLIDSLSRFSIGEDEAKAETCAAAIPGLIDALMPQVSDGSIHADVFDAVLYLGDDGPKKEGYMDKAKAFATAGKDNAKLDESIRDNAKQALESWSEG